MCNDKTFFEAIVYNTYNTIYTVYMYDTIVKVKLYYYYLLYVWQKALPVYYIIL